MRRSSRNENQPQDVGGTTKGRFDEVLDEVWKAVQQVVDQRVHRVFEEIAGRVRKVDRIDVDGLQIEQDLPSVVERRIGVLGVPVVHACWAIGIDVVFRK